MYLRYNTGLHISENGRALDALLAALVDGVAGAGAGRRPRRALHGRAGRPQRPAPGRRRDGGGARLDPPRPRHGHPRLPAPRARPWSAASTGSTAQLARLPETRPLARLLTLRSVGIKDLRRGTLVEADWTGRDLDALTPGEHTHVPLHDGARHFVVLATLSRNPEGRMADLLGDLLVPPRSATGDTGDDDRLAFPPDHVHRIGGLHHFDLLDHPLVYAADPGVAGGPPGGAAARRAGGARAPGRPGSRPLGVTCDDAPR